MFEDLNFDGVFDEMLEQMQQPGQREAMQKAFEASPEDLGKAAVEHARKEQAEAKREFEAQHEQIEMPKKWCNECCYGSHCLGGNPDCACCKPGDPGCYLE